MSLRAGGEAIHYSPLNAITGSSFAALLAGFNPKKIPTKTEKAKAIMQAFVFYLSFSPKAGIWEIQDIWLF
jgi:hypothetical protein